MIPLLDGDIIRYELGFAAETGWQNPNSYPPWEYCQELVDRRIEDICRRVGATQPPIVYLTGKNNFRFEIAKKRPYKERPSNKPYHYQNITAYLKGQYDAILVEGIEADDAMAIEQSRMEDMRKHFPEDIIPTVICSRDKDLLQVPGWHYSWELGNQPEFFEEVDELGWIRLDRTEKGTKIKGCGLLFFYAQCLTGDNVDTVPGLPKCGAVKAFSLLGDKKTKEEAFEAVCEAYRAFYGDDCWRNELLEQGRLLWMVREIDEEGKPVMWSF